MRIDPEDVRKLQAAWRARAAQFDESVPVDPVQERLAAIKTRLAAQEELVHQLEAETLQNQSDSEHSRGISLPYGKFIPRS